MWIGSKFKRPDAPVTLGDNTYFFKPVDPAQPDGEHICFVDDKDHAQRLLGITEGYYIAEAPPSATKPTPPTPAPSAPPAPPAGQSSPPPADPVQLPADDEGEGEALSEEHAEAAQKLNELSWQALQGQLKQGGIPEPVLREALRLEQIKPEDEQRTTTIKLLTKALEG